MPKRKVSPPIPNYQWLGGELSIGEIILDMAKELLASPNQLEVQRRTTEFVRRVNAAFAEQEHYIREQEKKGSHQKTQASPTREKVALCMAALIKKEEKVTAPAIEIEWRKQKLGNLVTPQQINFHLRKMKHT